MKRMGPQRTQGPYVFITHSWNLRKAAEAWEKLKGKEPFTARVIEKRTKDGKTVYMFA